jgi:hypothetical protein
MCFGHATLAEVISTKLSQLMGGWMVFDGKSENKYG